MTHNATQLLHSAHAVVDGIYVRRTCTAGVCMRAVVHAPQQQGRRQQVRCSTVLAIGHTGVDALMNLSQLR